MTHRMHGAGASLGPEHDDTLAFVQSESRRLEKRIRRRDARELIGGIVGALLIAPGLFRGPVISRIGAGIMVAGLVFIAVKLARARQIGSTVDFSLSVMDALRAELRRVDAQIVLLESVLWWYVAPVMIGAVMMVAGNRGAVVFTWIYALAVGGIAWAIVAMNARAARRTLHPKRAELAALLVQFDHADARRPDPLSSP